MTFREAFDNLKKKYGNSATLTFMMTCRDDGSESIDICAHGGGKCVIGAKTYEGAIASLDAIHLATVELPEGGE